LPWPWSRLSAARPSNPEPPCVGGAVEQWFREAETRPLVQLVTASLPFQRSGARIRQAVRDAFLVLAAFALLGAQALSTLHYVLVPHHLCAEHGVLEDGGGARAKDGTGEPGGHTATAQASEPGDQDDHEACSVATRHEQGVLLQRPAVQHVALTDASLVGVTPGVSLDLTRAALLSRAPKTSPPTRA
jgi:hypothetical protein